MALGDKTVRDSLSKMLSEPCRMYSTIGTAELMSSPTFILHFSRGFLDVTSFGQACFRQANPQTFCTMPTAPATGEIESQEIPMSTDL